MIRARLGRNNVSLGFLLKNSKMKIEMSAYYAKYDYWGFIKETLIRRILAPFLYRYYRLNRFPSLEHLFTNSLNNSRFLIIFIESTRYDIFKSLYKHYFGQFHNKLLIVRASPEYSINLLPKLFTNPLFNDVRIFYPVLSVGVHNLRKVILNSIPLGRNIEVIEIKPNKVKDLGTVLPSEVNDEVMRIGLYKRTIIWYAQPHFPWILYKDISKLLFREVALHELIPGDIVNKKLLDIGLNSDSIVRAYISNLEIVLLSIKHLINYFKNELYNTKIIITSTHGELLGEYGLYLHKDIPLPQRVLVPWLEVML